MRVPVDDLSLRQLESGSLDERIDRELASRIDDLLIDPVDAAWAEGVRDHPAVVSYMGSISGDLCSPVSEPWMSVPHQKVQAVLCAASGYTNEGKRVYGPTCPTPRSFASMVEDSKLFWWSEECLSVAQSYPVPRHVVEPCLPHLVTYHCFQSFPEVKVGRLGVSVEWVMISSLPGGDGFDVYMVVRKSGRSYISGYSVRYGEVYPDDFLETADMGGLTLAMLAVVNSQPEYVSESRLPRSLRRQVARSGAREAPSFTEISLPARASRAVSRDLDASSPERSHRWWVRGHFRNQYYPSTGDHSLIWIEPYMKGPEDAPVKGSVYAMKGETK